MWIWQNFYKKLFRKIKKREKFLLYPSIVKIKKYDMLIL